MPVRVEQIPFGQGINGTSDFPTIYEQLLSNLHLITDVPSTFLGVSTSAGIGTDKFRIEKAFLEKRSESDREKIENLIYQVADNYLIGIKANPNLLKNYDIKWRTTSVDDKKLEADTDLVSSQVIQQQLMNFQALLTEFGDDAANEYAVSIGKPNWYSQSGTGLQN
jgi:hypothetical protein